MSKRTINAWMSRLPNQRSDGQTKLEVLFETKDREDIDRIFGATEHRDARFSWEFEEGGLVLRRVASDNVQVRKGFSTFATRPVTKKWTRFGCGIVSGKVPTLRAWGDLLFGCSITTAALHREGTVLFIRFPRNPRDLQCGGKGRALKRQTAEEWEVPLAAGGGVVLMSEKKVDTDRILPVGVTPSHATPGVRLAKAAHVGGRKEAEEANGGGSVEVQARLGISAVEPNSKVVINNGPYDLVFTIRDVEDRRGWIDKMIVAGHIPQVVVAFYDDKPERDDGPTTSPSA